MASLDILYFNPFNLKNKIMKIEHKNIFRGPSKILKNLSWPINIWLKYFMAHQYMPKIFDGPHKIPLDPPSTYLMYGRLFRFINLCMICLLILFRISQISKAVSQRSSIEKVFLEISQISQENTCVRISFLIRWWLLLRFLSGVLLLMGVLTHLFLIHPFATL